MSDEKFIFRLGGNLHNVKPTITKDHALPLKESKTGFLDNTAGKRQTTDEGNSIQEVRILYYADLNRWRRDNNKITSNYCIHVEEFFSPCYLLLAS